MLKVKLVAAFYTVLQAATVAEAAKLARDHAPNLVISAMDLPDGSAASLCSALKKHPSTRHLPILAVTSSVRPEQRLCALEAGVQDVLCRPVDETFLLSRVRNLIRVYNADTEWQMRDDTSRVLGLAEDNVAFTTQPHCALVCADKLHLQRFSRDLRKVSRVRFTLSSSAELLSKTPEETLPDVYVLILPCDAEAAQEDMHLLSALRASAQTRHAGIIIVQTVANPAQAAHALDLGADDLMTEGFDAAELALRLNAVIRRKRMAAQLRATVRTGLQAAVFDPLTGLHNRRYAMPHLERIFDHARNTGRPFAVLLADLDHFKRVNDVYGHASGDAVLVEVATRLRRALRSSDTVARIGGEEFMIVMPGTTPAEAQQVALRICQEISSIPFNVPGDSTPIEVTTSIGMAVSGAQAPADTPDTAAAMLDRADKALYAAKGRGRNQVTLDRPAA